MIKFFQPKGLPVLATELAALTRVYKGDAEKAIKSAARTLVGELAFYTFPQNYAGLGKMSNAAVADVMRVIATPQSVYWRLRRENPEKARQWQAIQGGGRGRNDRIIAFLSGTSLAGIQLTNSPVSAMVEPHRKTKRRRVVLRTPKFLALNKGGTDKVIKGKQRRIGQAASGWAWAGKDIGGRIKVPKGKGVGTHKRRTGRAVPYGSGAKFGYVLHNLNPHIRNNLPPYFEQKAIATTAKTLRLQTRKALENINRRARRR